MPSGCSPWFPRTSRPSGNEDRPPQPCPHCTGPRAFQAGLSALGKRNTATQGHAGAAFQLGRQGWVRAKWVMRAKAGKQWWEEQDEYDMTVGGIETASSCWLICLAEKVGDPRACTHPFLGKEVEWEEELAWTPVALNTAGRCLSDLPTELRTGGRNQLGRQAGLAQVPALARATCALLGTSLRRAQLRLLLCR